MKICKQGHEREDSVLRCIECKKLSAAKSREKNKEAILLAAKKYRERNREKVAASKKECKKKNPELYKALGKAYAEKNKERISAYHEAYRKTNSEAIANCTKEYYKNNKKHIALKSLEYAQRTKDARNAYKKIWALANKEKTLAATREYYLRNKEATKKRKAVYRAEKPWVLTASARRRRICKLHRTPPWYNHADCVAVYKELKPGYHIDHIVPLQGKKVSGLHWAHNLQILRAEENLKKSNKFDIDTYIHELPLY